MILTGPFKFRWVIIYAGLELLKIAQQGHQVLLILMKLDKL
jgi:hypothetical protein